MVKILGQSGRSISDAYDVDGSIVGIERLEAREVTLVHEMGATIFSERASGFIRRAATGDILQSVNWDIVISDLPAGISRILGLAVISDASTRISFCTVSVRDPASGAERELPIFIWDTNEDVITVRIEENGAAAANFGMLVSAPSVGVNMPSMLIGSGQPQRVGEIAFRGATTAFGAGTVFARLLLYVAFSQVGGLSSRGLPIPSW